MIIHQASVYLLKFVTVCLVMRRLLSILLISALLFNIFGYYFTFQIIQQGYKKQFRKHISCSANSENTEILVISDAEIRQHNSPFKWMEEDEFRYYGKMYDIVKSEKKGDQNIFYCVNDKNEEKLMARFENYLKHHDGTDFPFQQQSNRLLNLIIKQAVCELKTIQNIPGEIHEMLSVYFFSIQTVVLNRIFIPPKVS